MTVKHSSRTPQQALAALLDHHAPQRLLLIGASDLPAVQAFQAAHPVLRQASGGGQSLARGCKDDPRWSNPMFSEVCKAFLKANIPTPPSVFARVA